MSAICTPRTLTDVELHRQTPNAQALDVLTAQEAWDHLLLPLGHDGGKFMAVTTPCGVSQAADLLADRGVHDVVWMVCEPVPLEQCIAVSYGYEGV